MLLFGARIGLGDEQEGIMELPDLAAAQSERARGADLDDSVLDVNATPNRGDCMSVFGIARDYAAAQERRYLIGAVDPTAPGRNETFPWYSIHHPARSASRVIRGVRPGCAHSPAWLRERLRRVGINSISAIVDVTNYVMTEMGQPPHAFAIWRN